MYAQQCSSELKMKFNVVWLFNILVETTTTTTKFLTSVYNTVRQVFGHYLKF